MNENSTGRISGLPPILPANPELLILGSMPSVQSLEKREYYGNPRNHFWPILYAIYQEEPAANYQEKIRFLHRHGIALWDTIRSCVRKGSLDASIKDAEPNDIKELVENHPDIRLIACNGTKSYEVFKKYKKTVNWEPQIQVIKLPSSSPVPGRYSKSMEGKIEIWKEALLPNRAD